MAQYIYNSPTYVQSDLKTMDSYLLEFAERYRHHVVSAQWIQAFTAFLMRKQEEYMKVHPRVKPVAISYRFIKEGENGSRSPQALMRIGTIFVRLYQVRGTLETFEEPLI